MAKLNKSMRDEAKRSFSVALHDFVNGLAEHISASDGGWTVKGFIDIYKNIYTISSDTKIVSKILEIHLFPQILQFAEENKFSIVLAEHQNWYPDLSFVSQEDPTIKFAVDLKTTYRDPNAPGHVNGFTLGSHGAYFKYRTSSKNIQFPYDEYSGHFCLVWCLINKFTQFCHSRLSGIFLLEGERFWTSQNDTAKSVQKR